jgi:hypothetical protein
VPHRIPFTPACVSSSPTATLPLVV